MSAATQPMTRRSDGAGPVAEAQAPAVLHIDLADLARDAKAAPMRPMPKRDALDEALLTEARKCVATAGDVMPRRELIRAALDEADRQQYWRDEAEEALVKANARLEAAQRGHHDLLGILFELVGYASQQLHCDPIPATVIKRVRALGSGFIQGAPLPAALQDAEGRTHG